LYATDDGITDGTWVGTDQDNSGAGYELTIEYGTVAITLVGT